MSNSPYRFGSVQHERLRIEFFRFTQDPGSQAQKPVFFPVPRAEREAKFLRRAFGGNTLSRYHLPEDLPVGPGLKRLPVETDVFEPEKFRGAKFDRTGIIWWNVRDGWPIVSDAIVDYYNSKKLAYYYLWNAQRTVCVLINDEEGGVLPLKAVNDSFEPAEGKVKVTDVESGRTVYKGSFKVGSNDRALIAGLPIPKGQGVLLIEYETGGQKFRNHYLYGEPPFDFAKYKSWMKKAGI